MTALLTAARNAKSAVGQLTTEQKNEALLAMADALEARQTEILAANTRDLAAAQGHISAVMLDRLRLTPARIQAMAQGIREVAVLPDPVGQVLEIQEETYTIVGVVGMSQDFSPTINSMNDYQMYVGSSSGNIYLPSAVWPVSYRFDEPQNVAIKVASTDEMATVGKNAADLLTERQIVGESSGYDYRSQDMLEQAQQLQKMSQATNTQLIWIASISLLVGGIGVMNIMLVSVTERTSEIGLKKALGAKKRRILLQFLTEAAVLTSLGGVIGVATGIGLAELISKMMEIPVAISFPAIGISVAFSTLIGVVFGLLPATQAANLNPIEALRRV